MELSREEQRVLQDRDFFRVKAALNIQLDAAFATMKETWMDEVGKWHLPALPIDITRGKIFRGENYKGFPYTLMDYPRTFTKQGVFAVRTLCWWGHEFSFTLHLQGEHFTYYAANLEERLQRMCHSTLFVCTGTDPWKYEFTPENYVPVSDVDIAATASDLRKKEFIKLSMRLGIEDHSQLEITGKEALALFGKFLEG